MSPEASELKELVKEVVGADDPELYKRACRALDLLLSDHE